MISIAIIPARGGSARIPRKNVRPFLGKPIIEYSIDCARRSGLFDAIWISTDDDEIERVAKSNSCQVYRRPKDDGKRGTQEVARELLLELPNVDTACVIYATCPLLLPSDLQLAAKAVREEGGYVVSSYPDRVEDCGNFYFGEAGLFRRGVPLASLATLILPIPWSRCIDINTPDDWARAERMYDAMKDGA